MGKNVSVEHNTPRAEATWRWRQCFPQKRCHTPVDHDTKKLISWCGSSRYCVHTPGIQTLHLGHKIGCLEWGASHCVHQRPKSHRDRIHRINVYVTENLEPVIQSKHVYQYIPYQIIKLRRCRRSQTYSVLEDHSLSAVRDCWISISATTIFRSRLLQPQHEDAASRGDKESCRLMWTRHWTSKKRGEYFKTKRNSWSTSRVTTQFTKKKIIFPLIPN